MHYQEAENLKGVCKYLLLMILRSTHSNLSNFYFILHFMLIVKKYPIPWQKSVWSVTDLQLKLCIKLFNRKCIQCTCPA